MLERMVADSLFRGRNYPELVVKVSSPEDGVARMMPRLKDQESYSSLELGMTKTRLTTLLVIVPKSTHSQPFQQFGFNS